jgi:hypothetical protein
MPSGAEGKEQRRYCSLYGSAAGGIKSTTIDCSATGIKEGTGRTAASALDKILEQVISVLNGQAACRGVINFHQDRRSRKHQCMHHALSLSFSLKRAEISL